MRYKRLQKIIAFISGSWFTTKHLVSRQSYDSFTPVWCVLSYRRPFIWQQITKCLFTCNVSLINIMGVARNELLPTWLRQAHALTPEHNIYTPYSLKNKRNETTIGWSPNNVRLSSSVYRYRIHVSLLPIPSAPAEGNL